MICDTGQGKHYLYRHIRLDKNEVFYVGIGTKKKNSSSYYRAFENHKENEIWKNIIDKTNYEVEILLESDDYDFIKQKEIEFISLYGRKDIKTGTLSNMTEGGQGVVGFKRSFESNLKISKALKGKPKTDKHRKNLKIAKLANPSPCARYWKGKTFSVEHKEKLSKRKSGIPNGRKGKKNKLLSLRHYSKYEIQYNDSWFCFFGTKTELKQMLVISHKTLFKCLKGTTLRDKNLTIHALSN